MRALIIFFINILFCVIIWQLPSSRLYKIYEKDTDQIVDTYSTYIHNDVKSYVDRPDNDMLRTIGYPLLINFFQLSKHWYILLILFNCIVGAWMAYIIMQLSKNWLILFFIGSFTVYSIMIGTDLLFATLFVTSIWLIRKNLWLHLLFLSLAALVRPSLAWFFLIEPFVLWFYGIRDKEKIALITTLLFMGISINPARNYINHGRWTSSSVLEKNLTDEKYISGQDNKTEYMIKTFKANFLGSHYLYTGMIFNKYKRDLEHMSANKMLNVINVINVLVMLLMFFQFGVRLYLKEVNYGNLLILLYFILPTLIAASGSRFRLPIEWILIF